MPHLKIDQHHFDQSFPDSSFKIGHRLNESPLFELPRLVELSRCLPEDLIEYNYSKLAVNQDPGTTPKTGLSVQETLLNIGSSQSWVVLKFVENDPDYERLLNQCLDEVEAFTAGRVTGMDSRAAFIFISSANSTTPFHFDPELNFLLQIRGTKTMHSFSKFDRELVAEEAFEEAYFKPNTHRNQVFREEFQDKARAFNLVPGEGVFVPVHAPHWVQTGDQVSISFSITFSSEETRRDARLYKLNGMLRQRLGISPTPVGQSPRLDAVKDTACRSVMHAKRLIRRGKTPQPPA